MKIEQKMFVKAAPERRVKDPYSLKLLAPEGEWKPREGYWTRRVLFGDCIECPPVEAKPEEPTVTVRAEPARLEDEPTPRPTKRAKKYEPNDGHGENQ